MRADEPTPIGAGGLLGGDDFGDAYCLKILLTDSTRWAALRTGAVDADQRLIVKPRFSVALVPIGRLRRDSAEMLIVAVSDCH